MKLAHLADPHLGFRQHHRQTPGGLNQREADVAAAFRHAIDGIIAARPDAVVVAGDLFHAVRPTNAAIVFAFQQFQRLREQLPHAPVVLIAGNHDTPRSTETGSILRLFEELGVAVASDRARRFSFPECDLSVLAVPHQALVEGERPVLRAEGPERHQVLVIHGEVEGIFPVDRTVVEYGGAVVPVRDFAEGGFGYVAWGHYHVQRPVGPRAWYAGSLEYVSPNLWGELKDEAVHGGPKGWLLVDVETGAVTPQPIRLARRVLDLDPLDAAGLDSAALGATIAARVAQVPGGIADAMVRLVVWNAPRHVVREVDHALIRAWKAEALHFQLDFRRPEPVATSAGGAPGRRRTLQEVVAEFLGARPLPAEVPRDRFVSLGLQYLDPADADGS